jgi:UDP-glucose 4-epimerase
VIAVTGATGFVGRRVAAHLRAGATDYLTLGRSPSADRHWNATDAPPDLVGVDAVLHLAAHVPASYNDPTRARLCLEVNALGTLSLLQAAEEQGVGHVVVMSSGNVYTPADTPRDESAPTYPHRAAPFYLGSKLLAELFASHYASRGLATTVLRPSSIYGPGMRSGVVRIFVDRLRAGEPLRLDNGGQHRSDLVFVDDVATAAETVVHRRLHGIFNVGSGGTTSILELAQALCELMGRPAREFLDVQPVEGPPTGFAPLDITSSAGTWSPTPLREGLQKMLEAEA